MATRTSGETANLLPLERKRASFEAEGLRKIVAGEQAEELLKYMPLFAKPPFDDQDMDIYQSYEALATKKLDRVTEAFRIVRGNPKFMFAHMKQASFRPPQLAAPVVQRGSWMQKVAMGDLFEHDGIFLHFSMMLERAHQLLA
jgi:hypothetical protein